ncbi:MAG: SAM-dependent chlorinase/fluorinase [Pirellulales bacterium]|nr:SAM-dependent chlorinase/fluorinase [Pirellulales bacterium]
MARRIITLTTDFGSSSPYVAAMKGVILSINPEAEIVDLTHAIPPQDIRRGALALEEVCPYFPADAIHVAVVDPGVGTRRTIVYAEIAGRRYLAPDNGLLSRLALAAHPSRIVALTDTSFWREQVSSTFHGRDIFAPVAAHLSKGLPPERLGEPQAGLVAIDWPECEVMPQKISGEVTSVDSFGNLITNITAEQLQGVPMGEELSVRCGEHETAGLFRTYGDQPEMTLIALVGSSGKLELAIVGENAAAMLGEGVGSAVTLKW